MLARLLLHGLVLVCLLVGYPVLVCLLLARVTLGRVIWLTSGPTGHPGPCHFRIKAG